MQKRTVPKRTQQISALVTDCPHSVRYCYLLVPTDCICRAVYEKVPTFTLCAQDSFPNQSVVITSCYFSPVVCKLRDPCVRLGLVISSFLLSDTFSHFCIMEPRALTAAYEAVKEKPKSCFCFHTCGLSAFCVNYSTQDNMALASIVKMPSEVSW